MFGSSLIRPLVAFITAFSWSTAAISTEYISCPADFVSFHENSGFGEGVYYKYKSRHSDDEWRPASIRRGNSLLVSEFENEVPVEAIYYTTGPKRENYYLVKSGKLSETIEYRKSALVGYGDNLKRALRADFDKRFSRPPFNANLVADVDLDVYQEVHLSALPSGSSLVSRARYLFDKKKGWHLTFDDGTDTFSDVTKRSNFAFPGNMNLSGDTLSHILEVVMQRYGGPGKVCVRIYRTLRADHVGLYLAFNDIFLNSTPTSVNFTLKFFEEN
ncbi:hypothetical protein FIV00_04505 [Labrenzia sp. THAF82]|nr:hypothetical protein FIV00_04505 [Labrenzia sp. THAF82]